MLCRSRKCVQSLVQKTVKLTETPLCSSRINLKHGLLLQHQHRVITDSLRWSPRFSVTVNIDKPAWSWQHSCYCTAQKKSPDDDNTGTAGNKRDTTSANTSVGDERREATPVDPDQEEDEQQMTVFKRFKKAYKEHGKILISVHVATSIVWYSSFVYAAKVGVDVVPLMEWMGFSDRIISPFKNSSAGDFAIAYLMYKLATPARYTVTLAGTNAAIKYLRKTGKMEPKQESLRELVKDSRDEMKERTDKFRDDMKEKRTELRNKSITKINNQNKDKR